MKNKKIVTSFVILIIFFLAGFFLINQPAKNLPLKVPKNIKQVKIAGQNINVSLALTTAEQAQGLSGKSGPGENEGMLFVFNQPGQYPFWMKDMNFPIDIIWLSEEMRVIYIKKNALPESYPETYGPNASSVPAKYVLEINAGFSDKNNLKEGDRAIFTYE